MSYGPPPEPQQRTEWSWTETQRSTQQQMVNQEVEYKVPKTIPVEQQRDQVVQSIEVPVVPPIQTTMPGMTSFAPPETFTVRELNQGQFMPPVPIGQREIPIQPQHQTQQRTVEVPIEREVEDIVEIPVPQVVPKRVEKIVETIVEVPKIVKKPVRKEVVRFVPVEQVVEIPQVQTSENIKYVPKKKVVEKVIYTDGQGAGGGTDFAAPVHVHTQITEVMKEKIKEKIVQIPKRVIEEHITEVVTENPVRRQVPVP